MRVSEKFRELANLRKGKKDYYNYSVLQRIYFNSKIELLGFSEGNLRKRTMSRRAQKIQRKIQLTTKLYMRDKSDRLHCRLQILHRQLFHQDRMDEHKKYVSWVSKLNKMNYSRASRSFFAELKSKNNIIEFFGPIKSLSGQLSTTLHDLKAIDKDATNPDYYRPIAILSTVRKIYEQILKKRLQQVLEEADFFSTSQAAYRLGHSTCDHLLVLQEIFFHYRYACGARPRPLYICFLDLRKALDTVLRKILFAKLGALGVSGKMFRAIVDLFTDTFASVRVGNFFSDQFEIGSGVMQGSKLGPLFFYYFFK